MDKGKWAWRISIAIVALVIVFGVVSVGRDAMTGEQDCPIFYDDKIDWVLCYTVNWEDYCGQLNCTRTHYSCGRPACDCRSLE